MNNVSLRLLKKKLSSRIFWSQGEYSFWLKDWSQEIGFQVLVSPTKRGLIKKIIESAKTADLEF